MLKPKLMRKLECMLLHDVKHKVIKELQRHAVGQLMLIKDELIIQKRISRDTPDNDLDAIVEKRNAIRRLIEVLEPFAPEKNGFLDDMLGVHPVTPNPYPDEGIDQSLKRAQNILSVSEPQILEAYDDITRIEAEADSNIQMRNSAKPYSSLEWDISWFEKSAMTCSVLGLIDASDGKKLRKELDEELEMAYAIDMEPVLRGKTAVAIACESESESGLYRALGKTSFEVFDPSPESGPLVSFYHELEKSHEKLKEGLKSAQNKMREMVRKHYRILLDMDEILAIEQSRSQVFRGFAKTDSVTIFDIWVTLDDLDKAIGIIEESSNRMCSVRVVKDFEDPPIMLDNSPLLKPFEMLTNMYSPPKYGRLDPTTVTAPTFVLFFGFMLGDAVYGAVIAILATLIKRHYPGEKKVADFMTVIQWLGASTIMFGLLTGSFFGNFLSYYVLGLSSSQDMASWVVIDPMHGDNATLLIILSAAVGVLHVFLGNILGLIDSIRCKSAKKGLMENGSWIMIISGAAVWYLFQPHTGAAIFILGFLTLMLDRGPMGLMGLPSVMGNVMSYTRLVALNLTTPGMAQAFNMLAAMIWSFPILGPIASAAVFILSHIIILFLNSLGSFVHTLRLHYVEYYGTFYMGGGTMFTPFEEKRKYTIRR